jgi:hypothetical protein
MDASNITALGKGPSQSGNVEVKANTVMLSNGSSIQTGMATRCPAVSLAILR